MNPDWYKIPIFYFSNTTELYGHKEDIPYPIGTKELDFELEIAVIINAWQKFKIDEKDIKKLSGKEVLVLSVDSDVCFYPEEQIELVDILELNDVCVNYFLLHSDKGHDAFLLEPDILFQPISTYL